VNRMLSALLMVLPASVLAVAQAPAQTSAPLVSIVGIAFNGNACLNNDPSADVQVLPLGSSQPTRFRLRTSSYIARQGPGVALALRQRFCTITVTARVAQGYQFSLADARARGRANLAAGITGTQQSSYLFPFRPGPPATFSTVLSGPVDTAYLRTDRINLWSPCGGEFPLTIRTQVFLGGNPAIPAAMTMASPQVYRLRWRRC
jgi:hypothetical protein